MEFLRNIVIYCLILTSICVAVEKTTVTNLTDLEQQLNVNKREKQYLTEDDPFEGSEQRRDGRQSTPKNNQIDPSANIPRARLQPKVLVSPVKPTMKPKLTQPIRIDTRPQRMPTKIPVVLKTTKVVPTPANAIRMKILESQYNESLANGEKLASNPNQFSGQIPTENRLASNDDVNPNFEDITRDGKDSGVKNDKDVDDRKDKNNTKAEIAPSNIKKPIHFFVDEPEPLPSKNQRILDNENTDSEQLKIKEIPIVKKAKSKLKNEEMISRIASNDMDSDGDVTRISNGTHLISIKKLRDDDPHILSRIGFEEMPTEERIVNKPPKPKPGIVNKSPKPPKDELILQKPDNIRPDIEENIVAGIFLDGPKKETKDQNCITITNHNYEEIEEKSPLSTPFSVQPISNNLNEDYLRYLQNSYYNPYYQTINDQYRRNYGLVQSSPNICLVDNKDPCLNNEEIIQPYYPNTQYQNCVNVNEIKSQIDPNPDNRPDRIWKNWKDIEIKIRKAKTEEPLDLDIRTMVENSDDILKNDFVDSTSTPSVSWLGNLYNTNGIFWPNPSSSMRAQNGH